MSEKTVRGWYCAGVIVLALASWAVWYRIGAPLATPVVTAGPSADWRLQTAVSPTFEPIENVIGQRPEHANRQRSP
jgi:hypothetical protein